MANASSGNGEPSKKETQVNFEHGSGMDADQVEVTIHQPAKVHKRKKQGYHFLPKPFERSNGSLLNPKFDSEILENYLVQCYFPQARRLFRNIIYYVAIASICWVLFFGLMQINHPTDRWYYYVAGAAVLLILVVVMLLFTYTKHYVNHFKKAGFFLALVLVIAIQLPFIFGDPDISSVGTFFGVVEILILLYACFPLNLFAAAGLGGFLSISYEVFTALRYPQMEEPAFIFCKFLLHIIVHLIGIFIYIMSNTRARSNFSKIGQSVSAQRDLMVEREIKEKMIHSLMPPVVAKSVMATHPSKDEEDEDDAEKKKRRIKGKHVKGEIIFRKFQMDEMSDVSILYADIVGFTKMSSNKSAERLVGLLNDLFGRFDKLCNASGCEKISTLGDCYYSVSGCPNACPDHAKNCVEMGLSMVIAINAFDEDHNEEVNMRVGIHTGTVLCGIVGTVRFKFDVWSNDVTLANIMESTGEPGKVHISEATREFLLNDYDMVEGEEVPDMRGRKELIEHYDPAMSSFTIKHREETRNIKTYFITGRKPGNTGIEGLEELADERPEQILREKAKANKDLENSTPSNDTRLDVSRTVTADLENGSSAAAADLFSQRIPDIMADDDDNENHEKTADDQGQKQPRVNKSAAKTHKHQHGKGEGRKSPPALTQPNRSDLSPTSKESVTLTSYKYNSFASGSQGGGNGSACRKQEAGVDSTLLKPNRSESVTEDQDKLLISLIAKEFENNEAFFKPNLNKLCLTFEPELEDTYRHEYKDSHLFQENMLSSPRYQTAVEALLALISLLILAICCHIMFSFAQTMGLTIVTVVGLLVQVLVFMDALTNITCLKAKKTKLPTLMNITLSWYFRNALGVIVATIPAVLVFVTLSCDLVISDNWHDRFFCFSMAVALLQYCNYTMLRSIAKTVTAILVGSVLIVLLFVQICSFPWSDPLPGATTSVISYNISNSSTLAPSLTSPSSASSPTTTMVQHNPIPDHLFSGENLLRFEIILSTLLLLLLICILNYEFENSYRLSFNASVKAQKDKENMQLNKDQADWLLHNIIPGHLAELFKTNKSYSRNHQDVGVIFATIVNFNEFYDEMYAGGREYLRVLNELVSDYEVMLSEPRFKDVEKIKTISSSFMAAAGLNEESRAQNKHPYAHLFALMEFAMELQDVVANFNESIFNFSFTLNIGYNYGPVTAGVIGTTKLLYDIWGDTVNIASRMYSTGEENRIQVPQATADLLGEMFEFSYRDEIPVKGKGNMKTYLLVKKKPGAQWE